MRKILAVATTVAALLAAAPNAIAGDVVIHAGLTDPLDTPYGEAMTKFKELVETGSDHRIEVQLFPSNQLGKIPEQLENVKTGAQEMSLFSPAYGGQFFPALDVLELPYLVTNWDEAERLLASDAFKKLRMDAAKSIGVKIIGSFPYGFRNVANSKHPVAKLSDFKGLKLRTQNSPVHIAAFRDLGANPVAIGWGETYQAVQTGVVDGLENANTVLIANRFPEIAPYVSVTHHLFGMLLVSMNTKLYDSLSPMDQKLIDTSMEAAEKLNLKRALEVEKTSIAQLTKMGAKVNEVPQNQIAAMKQAVQPVYKEFGPKFEPYLSALRAAAAGD